MAKEDVIEVEGTVLNLFQMQCLKLNWKMVIKY